jgi:hypothetical protein
MGSWIKLILEVLASFFGWRKNVTDPAIKSESTFQTKHDEWEQELKGLQDAETKAGDKWRLAATGVAYSGNVDQLRTEYLAASLAVGHCRAREPKRGVPGPQ